MGQPADSYETPRQESPSSPSQPANGPVSSPAQTEIPKPISTTDAAAANRPPQEKGGGFGALVLSIILLAACIGGLMFFAQQGNDTPTTPVQVTEEIPTKQIESITEETIDFQLGNGLKCEVPVIITHTGDLNLEEFSTFGNAFSGYMMTYKGEARTPEQRQTLIDAILKAAHQAYTESDYSFTFVLGEISVEMPPPVKKAPAPAIKKEPATPENSL